MSHLSCILAITLLFNHTYILSHFNLINIIPIHMQHPSPPLPVLHLLITPLPHFPWDPSCCCEIVTCQLFLCQFSPEVHLFYISCQLHANYGKSSATTSAQLWGAQRVVGVNIDDALVRMAW